jgi:HSP90 family molecular chaperone
VWDKDKSAHVATDEDETVNQANALWARNKNDITEAQYQEFYKHVAHDFADPLAWTHNRVEGKQEYIQLLYVPAKAPFDILDRQHRHGVKLYVRRVSIMDDAEQLLPPYLRFVRGVIDSSDLPLNVSREILQESRDVRAIREGSTKRVLGLLEDLAENRKDDYAQFWAEFGQLQPGKDRQATALCLDAQRRRRDGVVERLCRADEGRAEGNLLRHRRQPRRGRRQPAPGGVPQKRPRGTAARRPSG